MVELIPTDVRRKFEEACTGTDPLWDIRLRRLISTFTWYTQAGLADKQFAQQLVADDTYLQRLSEMLVAYKLARAGYKLSSKAAGPDLWASKAGRGFWVEVITPRPEQVDASFLNQHEAGPDGFVKVPSDQILRRWTSAISEKARKLLGTDNQISGTRSPGYLEKKLVKANEPFVIAINARNLRSKAGEGVFSGRSLNPCAVEALFAVGPLELRFGPLDGSSPARLSVGRSQRAVLKSATGADIQMTTFLDEAYAPISAVWALDIDESEMILNPPWPGIERNYFASAAMFNPHAINPLAPRDLPTFEDWTCKIEGDSYHLNHHDRIPFRPGRPGLVRR